MARGTIVSRAQPRTALHALLHAEEHRCCFGFGWDVPQALKKQVEAWRNGLADDYAKMKKLAPWVDGQPPCLLAVLTGPVLGSRQRGLLARADAWELIKKEQEAKARLDQKRQKVQRCFVAHRRPCSEYHCLGFCSKL